MVSLNLVDESSSEYCKYDFKCKKSPVNHCRGCGQVYCMDHYSKHQKKLQKYFKRVQHTQDLLIEKLKSLISQLSANAILDLIKQIYEFKMKFDEIEKTANIIQQQLEDLINDNKQDLKEQMIMTNGIESAQKTYLENDIEQLKTDIERLKLKLEEINNDSQKRDLQEQLSVHDMNVKTHHLPVRLKSLVSNIVSPNKEDRSPPVVDTSRNSLTGEEDDNALLSLILFKQSPSIIDRYGNRSDSTKIENKTYLEGEEEEDNDSIGVIDYNTTQKISRKIRLSNNIVSMLRGPFKIMLDGTMHLVEVYAQGAHASDAVVQAVKQGLARQNQIAMDQQTINNSFKPAFAEITPDWTFVGENDDRGFSSASIWMCDPQGHRILVKTHDHPLGAANEWLAYVLGELIGLPINEVRIAIHQNNLVTLHTDVTHENEKTITFLDLPKQRKKALLTSPIFECMDLFDHIIQNVDRNPRNILITIPDTTTIDDDTATLKICLIDHTACFGLGKLNGISVVATKMHSQHLSVVKFDPIAQARKFEQYLSKLPAADRVLIKKILNRFAAITNDQFASWMTEIKDLLTPSQYNRIHGVLYRQRDIARRYTIQWGICPRSSSVKSNGTNQFTSDMNNMVTYF
jgi:hypothetical protein